MKLIFKLAIILLLLCHFLGSFASNKKHPNRIEIYALGKNVVTNFRITEKIIQESDFYHTTILDSKKIALIDSLSSQIVNLKIVPLNKDGIDVRMLLEVYKNDSLKNSLSLSASNLIAINTKNIVEYETNDILAYINDYLPPCLNWGNESFDRFNPKFRENMTDDNYCPDGFIIKFPTEVRKIIRQYKKSFFSKLELLELEKVGFISLTITIDLKLKIMIDFKVNEKMTGVNLTKILENKLITFLNLHLKIASIENLYNKNNELIYRDIFLTF